MAFSSSEYGDRSLHGGTPVSLGVNHDEDAALQATPETPATEPKTPPLPDLEPPAPKQAKTQPLPSEAPEPTERKYPPQPEEAPAAAAEAPEETITTSRRYGESAIAAQNQQMQSNAQESRRIYSPHEPEKKDTSGSDRLKKGLMIAAVAIGVLAVGYFAGAWLLSLGPVQAAIGGIMHAGGLAIAHVGAFLQGMGILSVAPAVPAVAPAGISVAGGLLGATGAAVVATKSNLLSMLGLDSHSVTAADAASHASTTGLGHDAGMDVAALTTTKAKMASASALAGHEHFGEHATAESAKTGQYSMEHDHLTEYRRNRNNASWAQQVGGPRASRAAEAVSPRQSSFAGELQEARELQNMLGAEAAR